MEIILTQDIRNLGYKDDVVTVKDGYARNYLIPKGMAIAASALNKKILAENQRQKSFKQEKVRREAEALAKALSGITVKIGAKAATTGKIFGSVNAMQIADAIREQYNYEVDRKKIHLDDDHVKEIGTYSAKVNLHKDITVDITFEVFAE